MTRVHDMGGRFGDGPVDPQDNATFAQDWHARALAVTLACGALGQWNIDVSRHSRERLSPKDYTRFSYYEKWMSALADLLVEHDILSVEELREGQAEGPSALADKMLKAAQVANVLSAGGPSERESTIKPTFQVGEYVKTRKRAGNENVEGGHTRLPNYATGAVGQVVLYHGSHVLPDASAHGLGEAPEPLYAVAFSSQSLWGKTANTADEVILDLWQSYLEPV